MISRRSRRLRSEQRPPLGRRRGVPEPRQVPRHDRARRRDVLRRRDHRHARRQRTARPLAWEVESPVDFIIGFTYQAQQRLLHRLGRVVTGSTRPTAATCPARASRKPKDVRPLGQPGAHRLAPGRAHLRRAAAATAAAATATTAAGQNRPPTVKARCEPCVVEVGTTSTVTADANGSGRRRARLQVERAVRHASPTRPSGRRSSPARRRPARSRSP